MVKPTRNVHLEKFASHQQVEVGIQRGRHAMYYGPKRESLRRSDVLRTGNVGEEKKKRGGGGGGGAGGWCS